MNGTRPAQASDQDNSRPHDSPHEDTPPPPPPHSQNPKTTHFNSLPPGNYDIFIVPPNSSGSGFLYLPSLAVQRNSFLAGVLCTTLSFGVWAALVPVFQNFMGSVSGGPGVVLLVAGVAVAAWAFGKTQAENGRAKPSTSGSAGQAGESGSQFRPPPGAHWSTGNGSSPDGPGQGQAFPDSTPRDTFQASSPKTPFQAGSTPANTSRPGSAPGAQSAPSSAAPSPFTASPKAASDAWERAREETRRNMEAKRRADEAKKKKDEADRLARAAVEKARWEQAVAREKDLREREMREKAKARPPSVSSTPTVKPVSRPESPTKRVPPPSYASTISGTESSYGTATSAAMSENRGPYTTTDPDKILLYGVYHYEHHAADPSSRLIAGHGNVTDGLVLQMTTEGLFIDDDVRRVGQREWDVKAWSIKQIETGQLMGFCVLRVTVRDGAEQTKVLFVVSSTQASKIDAGIHRIRKGSQVRSMGTGGMKAAEVRGVLTGLGWL